ncbi:MAG: ribosomal RNA small subunit methyltransferase A [Porticoccaceae bacterium]|nr:MAG: ribosomal RNA small subunit methyltransferase A [Porticoccaceae bacterium]
MSEVRHRPRKRFGQHFLSDPRVVGQLLAAIAPAGEDVLVEIGPGTGVLTAPLLERCRRLHAVEIDRDLARLLGERFTGHPSFVLHCADALRFPWGSLQGDAPLRVVGNLPYNISTELLFRLLDHLSLIRDMHFMLQREVVERLAAPPGGRAYGRLSVMVQYHCAVKPLFSVPAGAFRPPPRVESAVVRLEPRPRPLAARRPEDFAALVRTAFQHRRKTLRNALKPLLAGGRESAIPVDLERRPETLSVEEYVHLANWISEQREPA